MYARKAEEGEAAGVSVASSPDYRQAGACLYGNERRIPPGSQSDMLNTQHTPNTLTHGDGSARTLRLPSSAHPRRSLTCDRHVTISYQPNFIPAFKELWISYPTGPISLLHCVERRRRLIPPFPSDCGVVGRRLLAMGQTVTGKAVDDISHLRRIDEGSWHRTTLLLVL